MDSLLNIVLTSAVIASCITSVANIIISLASSNRLKKLEKSKLKNELNKYRYTKLYEISLNWKEMNTPFDTNNKTPSEIATERIINGFIDDSAKYTIISPLLDEKHKTNLEKLCKEGNDCLNALIEIENMMDDIKSEELKRKHKELFKQYKSYSVKFSTELQVAINNQLKELLTMQ